MPPTGERRLASEGAGLCKTALARGRSLGAISIGARAAFGFAAAIHSAARFASLGSRICTKSGAFRRKSGGWKANLHNKLTRWRCGQSSANSSPRAPFPVPRCPAALENNCRFQTFRKGKTRKLKQGILGRGTGRHIVRTVNDAVGP